MLERILPGHLDNDYRGYKLAIWLFALLTVMKLGISLLHIFSADGGAQSVSTIPLDTYPPGAAQNVIALFSRMGLDQLLLGIVFVVVLIRYRALIPLMYALMVAGHLGLAGLARFKPIATVGTSGAKLPELVFTLLSISGLILSLLGSGYSRMRPHDHESLA
jgi:hypothetical protein